MTSVIKIFLLYYDIISQTRIHLLWSISPHADVNATQRVEVRDIELRQRLVRDKVSE